MVWEGEVGFEAVTDRCIACGTLVLWDADEVRGGWMCRSATSLDEEGPFCFGCHLARHRGDLAAS